MKRKIKILIICILLLTVVLIFIINYIKNITLYSLEAEIKDEFNIVKGLEVYNYGPHCCISVYVDDEDCEYKNIEPIFINMILKINEKDVFDY